MNIKTYSLFIFVLVANKVLGFFLRTWHKDEILIISWV